MNAPAGAADGFLSIGAIVEPKDEGTVRRLNSSALLVGQAPQDRGADARPAMDERPGMVEIDLPCGTRLRVDAFVNERTLRRVTLRVAEPVADPDGCRGMKVYLACHPVSMRLGFDGLAARVAQVLDGDPFICVSSDHVAASPSGP